MSRRREHLPALFVAVVLGLDGVAHLVWSTGVTWPAGSVRTLSYALLGAELPFTPGVLLPLAGVLFAAAAVVRLRARLGAAHRWGPLLQAGTLVVTAGATARALAGLVWAFGIGTPPNFPAFHWLNLLLYTPLCLALAAATLAVAGAGRPRRIGVGRPLAVTVPAVLGSGVLFAAYGWTPAVQDYEPTAYPGVESRYLDTDLARFHYTEHGDGGSPVVLLSPGAAWTFAWQAQAEALAADHTVYVVDLPGQGFTTLHDDGFGYDLAAMTGAVDTFLDGMELESVALGGLSWSGGSALAYTQAHPERVDRLVLLASSGADEPDTLGWRLLVPPVLGEVLTNVSAADRDAFADSLERSFVDDDRITDAAVDAMWRPNTFDGNRQAMYLLQRGLDWRGTEAAMPAVEQPTLILWGDRDRTLPVANARTFDNLIPDSELHVLEGCGHALTLDCPTEVNEAMAGFLS